MQINLNRMAAAFLLLLLSKTLAFAVCTCVRGTLKVSHIRGQVVATSNYRPNEEEPIPNANVKVLKCDNGLDCQTVAEVAADENGRFAIEGVKSGRYELKASALNFQAVVVGLKLQGSRGKKKEIVMALDPSLDCCAGDAKVRAIKSQ